MNRESPNLNKGINITKFKELAEVLEDTEFDDDYYIVSKKYKWLVSLNHHGIAIFIGDIDFEKVKKIYNEYYI